MLDGAQVPAVSPYHGSWKTSVHYYNQAKPKPKLKE